MNKINYLTFSGVSMCLAGIFVLLSENIGIDIAKFLVPTMFALGGILAYLFSEANKHYKLARQYHLLLGISMIAFAILISINSNGLEAFQQNITYFMAMFGLIEIMFGFMALNSKEKLNMGALGFRFFTGFCNLVGAVLILATSVIDEMNGILLSGSLVFVGGIAFIFFSFRIKKIKIT